MERRGYTRIDGDIRASILINQDRHAVATIRDLSASGLGFHFTERIELGDNIVAHVDGGARLEGDVVRLFDGGFAISLALSEHKRARLAETLKRAAVRGEALGQLTLERRLAARVTGMRQSVICETADRKIPARIIDMSLTGVAIEVDATIEMEAMVVIGKMRGVVVRREGKVYGVQFLAAGAHKDEAASARQPQRKRAQG